MYGLSIDPNTKESGLVGWIDGEYDQHETVKPVGKRTMVGTLWWIIRRENPDWVAIEDMYEGENPQTNIKLAGLVQSILEWCLYHDIPCYVLSTAEIDAACEIRHGPGYPSRKHQTQAIARFIITDQFISQHVADAVCVGMAALGKVKEAAWAAQAAEEAARRAGRD